MDEDEAKYFASDWVRRLEASVLSKVHDKYDKSTGGHYHRQDIVTNTFSNDDLYEKYIDIADPNPEEKIYNDPTGISSTSDLIHQNEDVTRDLCSKKELNPPKTPTCNIHEPCKTSVGSPRIDLEDLRRKRLQRFGKDSGSVLKNCEEKGGKFAKTPRAVSSDSDSSLGAMLQCEARTEESSLKDDWTFNIGYGYGFSKQSNDEDDKLRLELWGLRGAVESGQLDIDSYFRPSEDHSQNTSGKSTFPSTKHPLSDLDNPINNQSLSYQDYLTKSSSFRDNNYNLTDQVLNCERQDYSLVTNSDDLLNEENLPLWTSKLSIDKSCGGDGGLGRQQVGGKEDFTHFSVSKHQPVPFGCPIPQIEGKLYNGFETSDSESSVKAISARHKNRPKSDHIKAELNLSMSYKALKSGKGKQKILNELTEFLDSERNGKRSSREKERSQVKCHEELKSGQSPASQVCDKDNSAAEWPFKSSSPIELCENGIRSHSVSPVDSNSTSAPVSYMYNGDLNLSYVHVDDDLQQNSSSLRRENRMSSLEKTGLDQSGTHLAKICKTCDEVNNKVANWCIECGTALINIEPSILDHEQQRIYDKQCQETKKLIEEALKSQKQELKSLSKKERELQQDVINLAKEVDKNLGFSNKSLQSNLSNYKRRWLKSSLAWSTYEPQELSKPSSIVKQNTKEKKELRAGKDRFMNGSLRSRSSTDLAAIENYRKKNNSKNGHHNSGGRHRTASATYHSADDYDSNNLSINLDLTNQDRENSCGSKLTNHERPWSAKSSKGQITKSGRRRPGSTKPGTHAKSPSPLSFEEERSSPVISKKGASNSVNIPQLNLDDLGSYDRILTLIRSQRDSEPVPYLYLPDEILLEIFSNLSNKDLVSCGCVCSQFYRIAMDETLWKTITIRKNRNICDEWLECIGDRRPSSLTISQCSSNNVSSSGLRSMFRKCSESLEEVDFSGCSGGELIGESILLHISARCYNVVSVDVSWTNVSDNGVQALAESLKRLECLCLNGCQAITDKSLTHVSKKHGQSMRIFEVFGCFNITSAGLLLFGSQCVHLQTLNIGQCHKMTDSAVGNLVSHLPEIENLDLRGCKQTRDSAVKKIVRHCPHLKSLVLANCPLITDATLSEISTNLVGIRSLDICGCSYITDAGVRALARCCHKLEMLDLSSTGTAVTSKSIVALSNYCSQSLRVLKLSFCSDISVNTVNQVVKNCKKLTLLHLYGCKRIKELDKIKNLNSNLVIER